MSTGAPGATDAERAAWLADKIGALGDYAKEAAAMLRRWPLAEARPPEAARDAIVRALIAIGHQITADEIRFFRDPGKDTTALTQLCDSLEAAWPSSVPARDQVRRPLVARVHIRADGHVNFVLNPAAAKARADGLLREGWNDLVPGTDFDSGADAAPGVMACHARGGHCTTPVACADHGRCPHGVAPCDGGER